MGTGSRCERRTTVERRHGTKPLRYAIRRRRRLIARSSCGRGHETDHGRTTTEACCGRRSIGSRAFRAAHRERKVSDSGVFAVGDCCSVFFSFSFFFFGENANGVPTTRIITARKLSRRRCVSNRTTIGFWTVIFFSPFLPPIRPPVLFRTATAAAVVAAVAMFGVCGGGVGREYNDHARAHRWEGNSKRGRRRRDARSARSGANSARRQRRCPGKLTVVKNKTFLTFLQKPKWETTVLDPTDTCQGIIH